METIHTSNGLNILGELIATYASYNRKVFLSQDRICITDSNNNEITNVDLLPLLDL